MEVELDLSNNATKADLKKATGVDTSDFAREADLASLKLDVHKLDIDNLRTVPVNLRMLSNGANNDVVKKLCMLNWSLKLSPLLVANLF